MATRKTRRTPTFLLNVGLPRSDLIRMIDELTQERISLRTRTFLRYWLAQIGDQMPPKRDTKVNRGAWQIAMLAAALVDERNARPKRALLAAMETLAPDQASDQKFRDFIARTYRRLRAGKNPARPQLLPTPPEVLALARAKL